MMQELIQQGAEAMIYSLEYLGQPAIRKERFVKSYRHPVLDTRLTKSRIRAEVKAINCLKSKSSLLSKSIPSVLAVSDYDIVMTKVVNSKTLHEDVLSGFIRNDESLVPLFQHVGQVISEIHKCGLIHGDLTTSNFLKDEHGNLIPIDFGLATFSTTSEDRAVDLYVLERSFLTIGHDTGKLFEILLESYEQKMGEDGPVVIKKLEEVRSRGRKRLMVG